MDAAADEIVIMVKRVARSSHLMFNLSMVSTALFLAPGSTNRPYMFTRLPVFQNTWFFVTCGGYMGWLYFHYCRSEVI